MRGERVIRVLIADEIARIVGDLEKLEPYTDVVDVCGVAHQVSAVIEEAWLRQPDVLVLHEGFAELPSCRLRRAPRVGVAGNPGAAHDRGRHPGGGGQLDRGSRERAEPEVRSSSRPSRSPPVSSHRAVARRDATQPDGAATAGEPGRRGPRAPRGRATVVVTFSGKGGTGTSMVATNLAVTLADGAGGRVALVDIDLQFGDAAAMLHVENHLLSIADLAAHGDDIDAGLLDDVLATGPAEVRILRAPSSPELGETVAAANLRAIMRATAKAHAFVVVDTPSHIDERVLEVFELADRVLLVTSYNLSAVRGTKATLLLLEALGVDPDRVDVVLNHTRPRTNYRREDIEEILGRPSLVDLPYDPRVDPSLDSGTPMVLAQPRSELARRLTALADLIAVPAGVEEVEGRAAHAGATRAYRRRFSLGRR